MITNNGLAVDGVKNLAMFLDPNNKKKPGWLYFAPLVSKLIDNYDILNLAVGITSLDKFLFKVPSWPIGGIYFDGIIQTTHSSKVRATQHPVQFGATLTDHAIIDPATLSIDIMMSDSHTEYFSSNNAFLDIIYESYKIFKYPPIKTMSLQPQGAGRSVNVWSILKAMQLARVPIVIETKLARYENMIIEELSSVDNVKTLHALKCTVKLREVIFAQVTETQEPARPINTPASNGGQSQSNKYDKAGDTAKNKS